MTCSNITCTFLRFFGRPFVKRFAICYRTVVPSVCPVCPVCNVGVLCPNGCLDQDETWQGAGLGSDHIVLDGDPAFPSKGAQPPNFRSMQCCQTAGWIKVSLGREVDLGPGDIVLDRDPAAPSQRGTVAYFHGPIFGGAVPLLGTAGPHITQCGLSRDLPKWRLDPCSSLATIHGPKLGALCLPFSFFGWGNVAWAEVYTSVASGVLIHPVVWPHNRRGPTIGGSVRFGDGELGPHLTQCGRDRGLPPCQVSS